MLRYYAYDLADSRNTLFQVEGLEGGGPAKVAPEKGGNLGKGRNGESFKKTASGKKGVDAALDNGNEDGRESPSKFLGGNKTRTELLNEDIISMFENWSSDLLGDTDTWDTLEKNAKNASLDRLRYTMDQDSALSV